MEHYALAAQVYGVARVFARLGGFLMNMPGVSDRGVPIMVRLAFAFTLSLALYPVLAPLLPPEPKELSELAAQIAIESILGLIFGLFLQLFMGGLAVAGEVISLQTTLAFSQTVNPLEAQPSTSINSFLSLIGVTLIFVTDVHQVFLAGLVRSYHMFPAGHGLPLMDLNFLMIRTFSETFTLGLQLAAPFIVFSMVYQTALGFVAKTMPQFQIFFISTPLTVLFGLSLLALTVGAIAGVWMDHLRDFAGQWI